MTEKKKMGRPTGGIGYGGRPLKKEGGKQVAFYLAAKTRDLIREYSQREGISQSEFVDHVITLYHETPKIV